MRHLSLALLFGVAMTVSACAGQAETIPPDVDLAVVLRDYKVELSAPTVKAGKVRIGVKNSGGMVHQFDLIKTDLAPDKLAIEGGAKAKEDGLVKQVLDIAIGKVVVVTADLAPGNYLIICNVSGHYQLGMRAALKVE